MRVFERRWVLDRPFLLWNEASMDTLRTISEQPERSRRINRIRLSFASLLSAKLDNVRRRAAASLITQSCDRNCRTNMRAQQAAYRRLAAQERYMCMSYSDGPGVALAAIVLNLRETGGDPGINATDLGKDQSGVRH